MIPPQPSQLTESNAERRLFAELAHQLPGDYTVLHGVKWLALSGGKPRHGLCSGSWGHSGENAPMVGYMLPHCYRQ